MARVNALKFKRNSNGIPRMSVEIASINKAKKKEPLPIQKTPKESKKQQKAASKKKSEPTTKAK